MLSPSRSQQGAADYEPSYLHDVLGVEQDETEEQIDERVRNEAKELGVDVDGLQRPKPVSTSTVSSDQRRRSESINSRASQSTDLTSNHSVISREHNRPGDRSSRASLSFRDYDNFLARGKPNGRHSISFSPPMTPAQSAFSLPLHAPEAAPKRHSRRIKGLSILRLHRSDSVSSNADGCPHCPPDTASQRRAVHKLPCGHRLCTQALRDTIKSATDTRTGSVPSCCGIPIPSSLFELVMTNADQHALLDRLEQWSEAASLAPSLKSEQRASVMSNRPGFGARQLSNESKVDSISPHLRMDMEKVQDRIDVQQLRHEQSSLRDRFLQWLETKRDELRTQHESLRQHMKLLHETAIEDMVEHHADAISEAEDKQVKAEGDLRDNHAREKRDNATGLKHMEAYCAGTYATGSAHNRTVTDQDRAELEKARKIRDEMDLKHESAINVLRGEQGRRLKLRVQRQDKELQELRRSQRKEELEFERQCNGETLALQTLAGEKRKKIRARWELQNAALGKRIEHGTGMMLAGRLPITEWPEEGLQIRPGAERRITGESRTLSDS